MDKASPKKNCRLDMIVGTENNLRTVYDRLAGNGAIGLGSSAEFDPVAKQIRSFFEMLPRGSSILDVGPGRGDEARMAVDVGLQVTGLDISPKMQELFRKNVPEASTILADMTQIPLGYHGKFDAVFSSCSFFHLSRANAIKALREFRKVLKPQGGMLFLSTLVGNGEEELNRGRDFLTEVGVESWFFYHWSPADLLAEIKNSGFSVLSQTRLSMIPNRPDLIVIVSSTTGT